MSITQVDLVMRGSDDSVISAIFAELRKAELKFPGWPDDVVHGAAILAEEAGETVKAALDLYYHRGSREALIKEAAQTGAMAIRLLLYLQRTFLPVHAAEAREPAQGVAPDLPSGEERQGGKP